MDDVAIRISARHCMAADRWHPRLKSPIGACAHDNNPYVSSGFGRRWERMHEVGRCKLTVSKPELKAPLVSTLETIM